MSWYEQAACRGMDAELFFPTRGDGAGARQAKAVCASCPVRVECREAGVNEHFGIWAGDSERQRRKRRGDPEARAGWSKRMCAGCGRVSVLHPRYYCDTCSTPQKVLERRADRTRRWRNKAS